MIPTIYAVFVAVLGLLLSRTAVLRMQVLLCVLGGTTAIILPAIGGSTIVVPAFCLPFLVLRAMAESYGTRAARRIPTAGFWLAAAVLWGLVITVIVPRAFAGELHVMTIDRMATGKAMTRLVALKPVSGNVSQTAYAISNVATFLAVRYLLRVEVRMIVFCNAVLGLAALNCAAAAWNVAEFYLHLPSLLSYVRTAYEVFGSYEAAGVLRIHGTFPEASVFAAFTLMLLGFTSNLWFNRIRTALTGSLTLLLLVFLLFSTSGTAYGGLTIYGSFVAVTLVRRGYLQGRIPRSGLLFAVAVLLALIVATLIVFEAAIVDRVVRFFEITVVNKLDAGSGQVRTRWNVQAWKNFLDSYGLGVGFGTARPSSFLLVLLASIGAPGTLFYGIFLTRVLRPTRNQESRGPSADGVAEASAHAVVAALSGALLSGSSFDMGAAFYLFAAAASFGGLVASSLGGPPAPFQANQGSPRPPF